MFDTGRRARWELTEKGIMRSEKKGGEKKKTFHFSPSLTAKVWRPTHAFWRRSCYEIGSSGLRSGTPAEAGHLVGRGGGGGAGGGEIAPLLAASLLPASFLFRWGRRGKSGVNNPPSFGWHPNKRLTSADDPVAHRSFFFAARRRRHRLRLVYVNSQVRFADLPSYRNSKGFRIALLGLILRD